MIVAVFVPACIVLDGPPDIVHDRRREDARRDSMGLFRGQSGACPETERQQLAAFGHMRLAAIRAHKFYDISCGAGLLPVPVVLAETTWPPLCGGGDCSDSCTPGVNANNEVRPGEKLDCAWMTAVLVRFRLLGSNFLRGLNVAAMSRFLLVPIINARKRTQDIYVHLPRPQAIARRNLSEHRRERRGRVCRVH